MKTRVAQQILAYAASQPEGTPLTAKGVLHLGTRAAVDQGLSRLSRAGKLLRTGRGMYVLPVTGRFGVRPPLSDRVVAEAAKVRGETIAPHGVAAANRLGLTTQIPMRATYLTSGRSRQFMLGAQQIELQHAPPWQLLHIGRESGEILRAIAWSGRSRARELLAKLMPTLTKDTTAELLASRSSLPGWLAESIGVELTA